MEIENILRDIEVLKKGLNKVLKEVLTKPSVVGRFHKVSFEQFKKDYGDIENEEDLITIYEKVLSLPVRSSKDSAGHDFPLTKDIHLKPGESISISTGIRAEIIKGWVLLLMPRSGLGVKFRVQLNNTVGVIDGDYFYADNEGHIKATITNDGKEGKDLILKAGDRFIQGIFLPYGITSHDNPLGKRTGGHGSSGL